MGSPLSIKLIAISLVLGGISNIIPWSGTNGFFQREMVVVTGVVSLCLGVGLWQLKEWARLGAIIYELLSFIWMLFWFGSPKVADITKAATGFAKIVVILFAVVATFIPVWFLVIRKEAFSKARNKTI